MELAGVAVEEVRRGEEGEGVGDGFKAAGELAGEFAVELDVDGVAVDGLEVEGFAAFPVDAGEVLLGAEDDGAHVVAVGPGGVAGEGGDFEVAVEEGDVAGDFEVAAVVADAGGEGEAGLDAVAVDLEVDLGEASAEAGEGGDPVGAFADAAFERGVDAADDVGVEAGTGHEEEVAGRAAIGAEEAEGDAAGDEGVEGADGLADATGEAHFVGEDVGGAGGEDGERGLGAGEAVGDFVDGAVAAGDDDKVGSSSGGFASEFGGVVGVGGGGFANGVAERAQEFEGAVDAVASSAGETSGLRVVDQEGVTVKGPQ